MNEAQILNLITWSFALMVTGAFGYSLVDWLQSVGGWRYQVRQARAGGDNADALLAAKCAVAMRSNTLIAIGFCMLLGIIVAFPAPPQYQQTVRFFFRGYGLCTALFLLLGTRRANQLWGEVVRRMMTNKNGNGTEVHHG